jgi:hypothetical protein
VGRRILKAPWGAASGAAAGLLLGALALPSEARAQCVCGFEDGLFTTDTGVTVDGSMADWAVIHADPDNNVCDGPPIADRDAPVQSTGRDLTHFAFTWDDTSVYLFTSRVGSSSNVQRFVYYADVDNDGLMETGEPVIGANWNGNTRLVEVYIFEYASLAPGGDPMVDGMGFGDGYTPPGGFQNVPAQNNPDRSGTWGSATGLSMEFAVDWAELGLAPESPFSFHVASANAWFGSASFTAQIDDNLGGCGGGAGSTQFADLTFAPDVNLSGRHTEIVFAAHTLTNAGNGTDSFDLSYVISGDHTPVVTLYHDADASGTFTAGDSLLTDTDGDTVPDTGALAPGAVFDLLIGCEIGFVDPQNPSGTAFIETTATSSFEPLVSESVTDTVTILIEPDLLVLKSVVTLSDPVNGGVSPKAIPGAVVSYTIQATNEGGAPTDADSVSVLDAIPVQGELFVGDLGGLGSGPVAFTDGSPSSGLAYTFISLGSGADSLSFSNDGGVTFTYTPVPDADGYDSAVTHVRIEPSGAFAAATAGGEPSFALSFRLRVS